MADWNLPTLTSNYTDVLNFLKNRDENSAKMFDGTTDTNLPSGTKRWSSANARFEKWSGSAWDELVTLYNINVSKLGGEDSAFYRNASNLNAGTITTWRIPSKQIPYNAHELSDSEDLDDIKTAGFYRQLHATNTTGNNYPIAKAGSLLVQNSATAGVVQIYTTYDTAEMYARGYYTTWSAWKQISANTWRSITDSVSSTSSDVSASAKAVKTAYDLATSKLDASGKAVNSDKFNNLDSTQFVRSDVDAETSAKLRVGGSITGMSSSGVILQVNGDQRTGDVLIHEKNSANSYPTSAYAHLHNEAGVLQWNGNKIYHTGNIPVWNQDTTGNAATATKLVSIGTTFSGTYPMTINSSGVIYSHTGITFTGSTHSLAITGTTPNIVLEDTDTAQSHGKIHFKSGTNQNLAIRHEVLDGNLPAGGQSVIIQDESDNITPAMLVVGGDIYAQGGINTDVSSAKKVYHTGNIPTWNQNTTGNAATATNAANAGKFNNLDSTQFVRSDVDAETSAKLRVGGSITGMSSSGVILQVNGDQRTGDVLIHEKNSANSYPTSAYAHLHNEAGVLQWNGNKIYHAGNDGSGSGLNADLLNNLDSSQFLRSDYTHSAVTVTTTTAISSWARGESHMVKVDGSNSEAHPNEGDYYYYITRLASRDISGGYTCIAIGYSTGRMWTGRALTDSVYPTWVEMLSDANIPTFNQDTTGNAATATNATKLNNYLPNDLPAGIGVNQTWVDETSNRADNTTYTNTSDKPIVVLLTAYGADNIYNSGYFYVDDVVMLTTVGNSIYHYTVIIPSGSTYKSVSGGGIVRWYELK